MTKFIVANYQNTLALALLEAAGADPRRVKRLVLDLTYGEPGHLTLETFADDRMLHVLPDGDTIEVWPEDEADAA